MNFLKWRMIAFSPQRILVFLCHKFTNAVYAVAGNIGRNTLQNSCYLVVHYKYPEFFPFNKFFYKDALVGFKSNVNGSFEDADIVVIFYYCNAKSEVCRFRLNNHCFVPEVLEIGLRHGAVRIIKSDGNPDAMFTQYMFRYHLVFHRQDAGIVIERSLCGLTHILNVFITF